MANSPLFLLLFTLLTTVTSTFSPLYTSSQPLTPSSLPPPPPQPPDSDIHENAFFSHTALLAPILSHLGFHELSTAAPSLSFDTSSASSWSGPSTLFAPSDSSLHTCLSCSVPNLLREHIVPGLYTIDYLQKLAFGTKIETLSPGRCLTVTSTSFKNHNNTSSSVNAVKVFIGGVEITQPDLFNNGLIVIHGIQGYIAPLSPFSCDIERLNSLSFQQTTSRQHNAQHILPQSAIMRLMLRDAMLRLRNNGFSILSLAMRVKYPELISLNNMTIFALDDSSIFSGSHSYISSIKFHIVPNVYLTVTDLEKLSAGTNLPSLERGQVLIVTTPGISSSTGVSASTVGNLNSMRINYVRIKVGDLIRNLKIVVHSVYLPFPRIDPSVAAASSGFDGILGNVQSERSASTGTSTVHATPGVPAVNMNIGNGGSCAAGVNIDENGISCTTGSAGGGTAPAEVHHEFKPAVDLEEYHGL